MKHGERRDLIRHRLACITPSKKEVAETLARLESFELSSGQENYARRLSEFQAFRQAHPPGSIKGPLRPAAEEGDAAPPRTQG